jgi:hypothetical protein
MSNNKKDQITTEEQHEEPQEQVEEEEEQLDEETSKALKNLKVDDSAFQQDKKGDKSAKTKNAKSGKVKNFP